ncbi:hypothetical protein MLD38_026099 [Melastoma candidum]|uniref:Uncharacterized protein n=1 Tax=Melastoma candidum TaxID=119954 RepID=A0ACB9NX79_9MYRT|nr:hypothetical protein MLD38_026099 [Melastoma candidum]
MTGIVDLNRVMDMNKRSPHLYTKVDSLLESHLHEVQDDEEEGDQEWRLHPHRTIEEILNDSISDSSSSHSSPPSPVHVTHRDHWALHDSEDEILQTLSIDTVSNSPYPDSGLIPQSNDSLPRVKPPFPPPPPPNAQRPSLFSGVRSNAKPGAAFAAAAAASRTFPTPHAHAIKSQRALLTHASSTNSAASEDVAFDALDLSKESSIAYDADDQVSLQDINKADTDDADNEDITAEYQSAFPHKDVKADFHVLGEEEDAMAGDSEVLVEEEESSIHIQPTLPVGNDLGNTNLLSPPPVHIDGTASDKESTNMVPLPRDDTAEIDEIDALVQSKAKEFEMTKLSEKLDDRTPQKLKKPLELAEELERKKASTGLHWEEGAVAQPMRLEGVRRGSTTLGYFDTSAENYISRTIGSSAFQRDHGSPQVLQVHLSFIAVGLTKGIIVVVPAKYSIAHVDNMETKMMMLGLQGDRINAAVTSMCFNQPGDLLLAGYANGHIAIWDLQRASAAKVITGEHAAPVVHTLFLGQDSQVTRQFKAVTGDTKGLLQLHSFSVVPLLNRFSFKTQCLLDGQNTGTVLSASALLDDDFSGGPSISQGNNASSGSSIGGMVGGVVGAEAGWKLFNESTSPVEEGVVVLVTHQTALVVRLSPALKVYATLSRPDGVREGSMPYTAWKSMTQGSESSTQAAAGRVSLLAIAWDRKVQVAKLVSSDLKVCSKWALDSTAIGVAWLDDQMLVVMMATGQICLFTRDGSIIHQTSFAVDGTGGDDLVMYHTQFVNIFGNPEKAYHNSIAVRGASVYFLGPFHLIISRLLPWKERIYVLRKGGDWMGALNMAMALYDGQAHGVIDLPRTLVAVQDAVMPYLVELLFSYVDEVFSYISVAFCNQVGKIQELNEKSSSLQAEIKEQFTRVGGVAVEFCVHINRTDILFDDVFSKFVAVHHKETFLELLEPYILKDMLSSLPPEIMQALVEHYSSRGWLQRVEQCVLHMDISSLDFNQVVKLCREHGLYCALVYLFNRGLDDYRSPLEELLLVLRNSAGEDASVLGYRMLVYIKYCFSGLAFPPGRGTLPPARLPSLRAELVRFLLERSNASKSRSGQVYYNLYYLLEVDAEATLDVLRYAFPTEGIQNHDASAGESDKQIISEDNHSSVDTMKLIQDMIDALIFILDEGDEKLDDLATSKDESGAQWSTRVDTGHLLEFIASFVAQKGARIPHHIFSKILKHLTTENTSLSGASLNNTESAKRKEKQVLSLLDTVPKHDWDASFVLSLCEKAQFHQVCAFIYTLQDLYVTALESYMKDMDEPVHAFAYIDIALSQLHEIDRDSFRSAVISRIPRLICLSREGTFFLIMDHFSSESFRIISELNGHQESLFLYLKTVIEVHFSGTLDFSCLRNVNVLDTSNSTGKNIQLKGIEAYLKRLSDFPKYLRNNPVHITEDMIEQYLELLCQYEPNSVLKFLEAFDSYRVEHCLQLCQRYGITDAAAFLLERVGDAGSALSLTLSCLNSKVKKLEDAVVQTLSEGSTNASISNKVSFFWKMEEVHDIRNVLHSCITLCQRNTPRLNPEESEALWFRLLDAFCEPLIGSGVIGTAHVENNDDDSLMESSKYRGDEVGNIIKWRISRSKVGAHILRRFFSHLVKEIVEGMIGYVCLPVIMSKLLSDNGNQEFGDFKLTILGMLGTYGFERRILDSAKSLIEDDTYYTMSLLKKGASHGFSPRSLFCCICNCLLTKNSSSSTVRIFSCGHATHVQCENLEIEAPGMGSLLGCPICLPKKKIQKANKSVHREDGLVGEPSSRQLQLRGSNALYANDSHNDPSDILYTPPNISRYDILTKIDKGKESLQIESIPQLRLAPPAVYHEKVKKGLDFLNGESSGDFTKEKVGRSRPPKAVQKGSALRFPLKTSIFGKEKYSKG